MIRTGSISVMLLASGLMAACLSLAGCGAFVSTQAHMERARQDMAKGDYRGAFIELHSVLRWSPHDVPVLLLSSEAALELGDATTAGQQLAAAVQHGAQPQSVAALRMRVLLAQGKAQDVLDATGQTAASLPEPTRSIARGAAFTLLGQTARAEEAYRAALGADPSSSEARTRLAEALATEGKMAEARQELDTVLSRDPRFARAWRARAAIDGSQGQYPQMEHALRTAVTYAPGQLDIPQQALLLDALAETRIKLGDLAGAQAAYKSLTAIAPEAPVVGLVAGQLALAQHQYDAAVESFQAVVDTDPQLGRARLLLAQALMEAGDLGHAQAVLSSVLQDNPDDSDARKLLARVRLRNGWPDGAEAALQPLEAAGTPDSETDALLSAARMQEGHETAAVTTLEQAAARAHPSEQIQLLLAGAYLQTGARAKAFATLGKLTAAHPRDVPLLDRIAAMLISHGELLRADATLSQALAIAPADPTTQLAQAQLALRRRDFARARQELDALQDSGPDAVPARLLLAQLDIRRKRSDEADPILKELEAAAADNSDLLTRIGHLYLDSGRNTEALTAFEAAAHLAPADSASWVDIAEAQLALEHPHLAAEAGTKALQLAPRSVAALRVLALADLRTHHPDAALKRVEDARSLRPGDTALWELEGDVRAARGEYAQAAAAFDQASKGGGSAALAIKSFKARQASGAQDPQQPLESWVLAHPGDIDAQIALAQAYQEAGRTADATREYQGLVAKGVADALVLDNLAWLYQSSGDPRALATARQAYQLDSGSAEVADTYGWALVQAGQTEQARGILQIAARASSAPGIRFHYAVALLRSGDRQGCRKILSELLEGRSTFPERGDAARLLRTL